MQEEMGVRSPSFREVTSDSPVDGDEQRIAESNFDGESPVIGLVLSDEAERSERGGGDENAEDSDEDDDFEFTFAGIDRESEWYDQSGEVFPIFDRRLLSEEEARAIQTDQTQAMETMRSALKKLFVVEDRDQDEAAELEGVAPESYCVWTPGSSPRASPARCKKSSSTGSTAKRWGVSLRELLIRRSRSDGNGSFVRFGSRRRAAESGGGKAAEKEVLIAKKGAVKGGGEKRRETYLPYKKAIVGFGFFPHVNGFGGVNRTRPPF